MPRLQAIVTDDTLTKIDARARPYGSGLGRSEVAQESLERYFTLLARALPALRAALSEAEVSLLADAWNGTLFEAWSIYHVADEIEDALSLTPLAEKWGVDQEALLAKLRGLGAAEAFALVDAVERFWTATTRGENPDLAEILNEKARQSPGFSHGEG